MQKQGFLQYIYPKQLYRILYEIPSPVIAMMFAWGGGDFAILRGWSHNKLLPKVEYLSIFRLNIKSDKIKNSPFLTPFFKKLIY